MFCLSTSALTNKLSLLQNGFYGKEFTTCGIVLAVCFFPLGIICCWMMREDKCTSCGNTR